MIRRHRNKTYVRIPGGEIQYGRLSKTIVVWFRRRCYGPWSVAVAGKEQG